MLYALRYKKHSNNDITGLVDILNRRGLSEDMIKVSRLSLNIFYNTVTNLDLKVDTKSESLWWRVITGDGSPCFWDYTLLLTS